MIDKLHDEHCSLVVLHDGKIHTYSQKGIKDLFYLLEKEPETLYESKVADKVVGKAAAGLLVSGNVTEIYADIISAQALPLIENAGIKLTYGKKVDHIRNQVGDDWCPMECLTLPAKTADEIVTLISEEFHRH